MLPTALELICCPGCRGDLEQRPRARLCCRGCGRDYPIVGGVPELFADEAPRDAEFDSQWRYWREGALESAGRLYGMAPEAFVDTVLAPRLGAVAPGALVVDAGCGTAERAARLARRYPHAQVLGFDIAHELVRSAQVLDAPPNLHLVRADIQAPPLRDGVVDRLISWGVIHHVAHPRAAFDRLAATVAPGGVLVVWLYPLPGEAPAWRPIYWMRDVAFAGRGHRLPPRARLWASKVVSAAALLPMWAGLRSPRSAAAYYPALRALSLRGVYECATTVAYDTLTPEHQHRFGAAEVQAWFRERGFGAVSQDGQGGYAAAKLSS